jgi:hypothetical protein
MKRTYVAAKIEKVKKHLLQAEEGLAALTLKLQQPRQGEAAPEPPPEKRDCPACGKSIMAAATICGYCWKKPADWVPSVRIATAAP